MLICRDVARPVGAAYSLREPSGVADRLDRDRTTPLDCRPAESAPGMPVGTSLRRCLERGNGLDWISYRLSVDGWQHVVEGLAAYDSVLRLAVQSLAEDRVVPGKVDIVTTGGTRSLAQARASLGDTELLIGQGYRRNNDGNYADAEGYFSPDLIDAAVTQAGESRDLFATRQHEVLVNQALQVSNLGRFSEAARLFDQARSMGLRDPIQSRLLRNFEAIDAINQGDLVQARAILVRSVPELVEPVLATDGSVEIDRTMANGLNSGLVAGLTDQVSQETRLTGVERASIIDVQAEQLGATVERLEGKPGEAIAALSSALQRVRSVREGRVVSVARLEAQFMSEMALAYEAMGDFARAESLLKDALSLTSLRYPASAAVSASQARLAAYFARHGRSDEAVGLYRQIVARTIEDRSSLVGFENQLGPYFAALAARPDSAGELFAVAQLIERPGAAQTLSQLSRRLEAGDSEASELFRREASVRRELNRLDLTLAQLKSPEVLLPDAALLAELDTRRSRLRDTQLELFSALSAYPAYRSLAREHISSGELIALLGPDEAYLKLVQVGDAIYAIYLSKDRSTGWKVTASNGEVAELVRHLRDSISLTIGGVTATYPFDVDSSRTLYDALFGPVSADLVKARHLIFEPSGPMMELPVNLLIADQRGVDDYHRKVAAGGDEFDFRGIAWLGRERAISTTLSASSFRDARKVPSSNASGLYLGLGQNKPTGQLTRASLVRSPATSLEASCEIPLAAWNSPIPADELIFASRQIGATRSELITGEAFTDTAIASRPDLANFRIVHFATHGIVTAPSAACPVRPALLTSFGGEGSDGLLQFGEIFDLKLDADLVILSACNTASLAGLETTREAGIEGGGSQALDGLVRAFIGAGGQQVIASHWPAPEEFGATRRLFESLFASKPNQALGDALLAAQRLLMDDADTSHPFYWSGFALIGDGARPLFRDN